MSPHSSNTESRTPNGMLAKLRGTFSKSFATKSRKSTAGRYFTTSRSSSSSSTSKKLRRIVSSASVGALRKSISSSRKFSVASLGFGGRSNRPSMENIDDIISKTGKNSNKKKAKFDRTLTEIRTSCWVVSLADALEMTEVQPHDFLKNMGIVRQYDKNTDGDIIFISHQFATKPYFSQPQH